MDLQFNMRSTGVRAKRSRPQGTSKNLLLELRQPRKPLIYKAAIFRKRGFPRYPSIDYKTIISIIYLPIFRYFSNSDKVLDSSKNLSLQLAGSKGLFF